MKKFLKWFSILFLILCLFFSCTQVRKNTIAGQIDGLKTGDKIVLTAYNEVQEEWSVRDSTIVKKDGEFLLKTSRKNELLRLYLLPRQDSSGVAPNVSYLGLFAEGLGRYTLSGSAADFSRSKIAGGIYEYPQVKAIDSLLVLEEQLREEYLTLDKTDTAANNVFNRRWREMAGQTRAQRESIIAEYPDQAYAAYILQDLAYTASAQNVDEIEALYSILGGNAQKTRYGKWVKKRMENIRNSSEGGTAPDFTLTSATGDTIRLSGLRGPWTVLDFWASWCQPCRIYNPHLVALYEKYHEAGLEVIGVAVSDQDAAWRLAIEEDGLPWINVNSGEKIKGQDNVAATYAITSIPTTLLLDPDGKIVFRGHPSQIDKLLVEAFPEIR